MHFITARHLLAKSLFINKCWDEFRFALDESIKAVEPNYFRIKRDHDEPAWRERAYCYELYHQLRCHLGKDFPYTLHGEIDKKNHEVICKEFEEKKCPNPDFVVHVPGDDKNLLIIEVKLSTSNKERAQRDINKLEIFLKRIRYQYGIFLVFGSEGDVPKLIEGLTIDEGPISEGRFCVLWHKNCEELPEVLKGSFQRNNFQASSKNKGTN